MGAIPNPKVTMEFSLGTTGWQESHTYANNVAVSDPNLYDAMKELAKQRTQCLGGNVKIELVKASQEQINRDVAYLEREDIPLPNPDADYPMGPSFPPRNTFWTYQTPQVSWPLKLTDAFQNQIAITYLAGMPASTFQSGSGPYDVSAGGSSIPGAYLTKYAKYLVRGPWGVAARTWPAGPFTAATAQPMTAVPIYVPAVGGVPAMLKFGFTQPLSGVPLVPGSWIRVGGMKYTSPQRIRLNGSWQVFNVAAGVVTVLAPRVKADPNFASIGYGQAASYAFQDYIGYTLDNITHKKRGRVASSPAGRQSRR